MNKRSLELALYEALPDFVMCILQFDHGAARYLDFGKIVSIELGLSMQLF
jgi:hypothetical protein